MRQPGPFGTVLGETRKVPGFSRRGPWSLHRRSSYRPSYADRPVRLPHKPLSPTIRVDIYVGNEVLTQGKDKPRLQIFVVVGVYIGRTKSLVKFRPANATHRISPHCRSTLTTRSGFPVSSCHTVVGDAGRDVGNRHSTVEKLND